MKVAIVGGGVAGLATGWRLARRGAEVTVIERGEPGAAATWAAAGMIAVAGETACASGAEIEFARHSGRLWPSFAAEVENASGTPVSYLRNGALFVAGPGAGFAAGQDVSPVTIEKARTIEPMLTGASGEIFWAPCEAQVDNRVLGRALARAVVGAGGKILRAEAVALEMKNNRAVGVQTTSGVLQADAIVAAAGAWTSYLDGVPKEFRAVRPIKGEMIALAGSGGPLSRVVRSAEVYLVPRGARVFVGATVQDAGFDTLLSPQAAERLHRAAAALIPLLAGWTVVEHWAGFRPGTADGMPVLGPTSVEGLFAATGQFRNGILFAPALADLVSSTVLDRAPVPIEFSPRRFVAGRGACA